MSPSLRLLSVRLRRRITLALVVAILVAGFAQAAHFHKDELAGHETPADIHCLLCQFAGSTAGPPSLTVLPSLPARIFAVLSNPAPLPLAQTDAAAYDARGPPLA